MSYGSQVYDEITDKRDEFSREMNECNRSIDNYEDRINALNSNREQLYVTLARIYLPSLESQDIKQTIKEKQTAVNEIFQEKLARKKKLTQLIDEAEVGIIQYKEELSIKNKEHQKIIENFNNITEKIGSELAENGEYQKIYSNAREFNLRIKANQTFLDKTVNDNKSKLKEFENNKFFMYLHNRNFLTNGYSHSGLIKSLDSWIATLVNYDENKKNYDVLEMMPELMEIELDKRKEEFSRIAEMGTKIEKEYEVKHKLYDAKNLLASNEEEISQVKVELINLNEKKSEYFAERSEIGSSKDKYHLRAIAELEEFLGGKSINDLVNLANETPSTEDDNIVSSIKKTYELIFEYKNNIKDERKKRDELKRIYDGLDNLADRFSRNDYDSGSSRFRDSLDMSDLLIAFIAGRMTADSVWNNAESHHYTESYHSPSSRDDYSPSSGGFGGGSYSSSGGFGGGGFSSGGGF